MSIKRILMFMVIVIIFLPNEVLGNENMEEILDISSFIAEAGKYTEEVFENTDFADILSEAMNGEINTSKFTNKILNLLGIEIKSQITMIGSIIVIIVVHSILKSISDGLDNGRNKSNCIFCSIYFNCNFDYDEFFRDNYKCKRVNSKSCWLFIFLDTSITIFNDDYWKYNNSKCDTTDFISNNYLYWYMYF